MADLVYRIGVQKLLDHLVDSTVTLQNGTNCLFATLVQPSYTADESHDDMTAITGSSHEWDNGGSGGGAAAAGGQDTGANSLPITVASVSTGEDSNGKIQLILPNLEFGNVTAAGPTLNGCVIYVETSTAAADTDRFPLLYLSSSTSIQPVASQSLTWVTNTNGICLFDPNP